MRNIEELQKIFSERLNLLMKENNITENTYLARKTKIDNDTIGNYLNRKSTPNARNLVKLADFFGVSTSYLLGETDVRTADDIIIGNEIGIDDTTLNNLKEIMKINQKYNNEYQDILGEILTDVELYKTIVEKIDLYVRYYSDKEYKNEFDRNNNILLTQVHNQVDFSMASAIKSKVDGYLNLLHITRNLNGRSLGEHELNTRLKLIETERRHIKETMKRRGQK